MLLASNHMFPTGSIEGVFERIAAAGAGALDLFPPHVPYLDQPRFSEKNLALLRRIDYPIERAQQRIVDAGLPQVLADRLAIGY